MNAERNLAIDYPAANRRLATRSVLLLVTTAMLCVTAPRAVMASLGGDVTSVESDRVHMKAAVVKQQTSALYTIHAMTTPSGTVVQEYANANGVVFAVTWNGPFLPDLRQALGTYFDAYQSAPRAKRYGHAHDSVEQPGLVVHSSGHMRSFAGIAYVPQLVPAGTTIEQIMTGQSG